MLMKEDLLLDCCILYYNVPDWNLLVFFVCISSGNSVYALKYAYTVLLHICMVA